jgi:hypothetical protein
MDVRRFHNQVGKEIRAEKAQKMQNQSDSAAYILIRRDHLKDSDCRILPSLNGPVGTPATPICSGKKTYPHIHQLFLHWSGENFQIA